MEHPTCGKCGYELSGLAQRGHCPECGRAYDLYTGEGTSARRIPAMARHAKSVALCAVGGVVLMCSGIGSIWASHKAALLLTGLAVAGVAGLFAGVAYLQERAEHRDSD